MCFYDKIAVKKNTHKSFFSRNLFFDSKNQLFEYIISYFCPVKSE